MRCPSDDDLKASAARARLRERDERRLQETRKTRFRWALWLFGLLLLAGLVADLRHHTGRLGRFQRTGSEARRGDAADIRAGLEGPRYEDPGGRFSVVAPRHWTVITPPPESPFQVVFQGPYGMDMGIEVVARPLTFEALVEELRQVERRLAATTHMDYAYVGPYRAIKRSTQLHHSRILALDFLTGSLAHHVQFRVPTSLYDEYEPLFLQLMQTYRAVDTTAPALGGPTVDAHQAGT